MDAMGRPFGTPLAGNIIRLIPRADRRQLATRRAHFRGGRRAEDHAQEVQAGRKTALSTEENTGGPGSAIVMRWESLPGTLRRAAGSF
jgi:hypothetical protein